MVDRVSRSEHSLLAAPAGRVVVAAGAMGTMSQARDLSPDDFAGLEGCDEIVQAIRPDVVRAVHRDCLDAGADAIETATFEANLAMLDEDGISGRIQELATAGARLARESADEFGQSNRCRFVRGSAGPGTTLPTPGHAPFTALRDAYVEPVAAGEVDVVAFHLATMGQPIADYTQDLRLPGGRLLADGDPANIEEYFSLGYRGARFPRGLRRLSEPRRPRSWYATRKPSTSLPDN